MCQLGEMFDIKSSAGGVDGGLEVHDIAFAQTCCIPALFIEEVDDFGAGEFLVDAEHAVAAVVARADGDDFGVQPCEESVESGEAGAIRQHGMADDRGEHEFEAGRVGGIEAGVDVAIAAKWAARRVQIAEFELAGGIEVVGIGRVAVCGGDVEGRSDVDVLVDRIVGVDCSCC